MIVVHALISEQPIFLGALGIQSPELIGIGDRWRRDAGAELQEGDEL